MNRRSRSADESENHERWLISYADFITLLFAFFVVLFANSQVDQAKVQQVSEAVRDALEPGSRTASGTDSKPQPVQKNSTETSALVIPESDANQLVTSFHNLKEDFRLEIEEGKVQVQLTQRGLVISMREAAFFRAGDDVVQTSSYPMIEKLAKAIQQIPNMVRMEGHTDSTPISNFRFRSNWELSAARSIAMMEMLAGRFAVPHERLAIAGFADVAPVAPNDSDENRARNRRVDVVILSGNSR